MTVSKISSVNVSEIEEKQTFVLDANVLYFIHSGYYSLSNPKNIVYSNFIQSLIVNGNKLVVSVGNIQELLYGVENKEYLIYCKSHSLNTKIYTKKHFRADSALRNIVYNKMKTIMAELKSTYELLDFNANIAELDEFMKEYTIHRFDPIDFFVASNIKDKLHINFITDDSDFKYSPYEISVFTE